MEIDRIYLEGVVKVVKVPHPHWRCHLCGKLLKAGEYVAKAGRVIICTNCVRRGR